MVENDENSQIVVTILTSKVKDEGTVLSLLLEVIFLVLTEKMKEVEVFFFFFLTLPKHLRYQQLVIPQQDIQNKG